MRALTLWRPWDQPMLYGSKIVENRPWALWPKMIGKYIALHAGKKYDKDGVLFMTDRGLYTPRNDTSSPTGIVGVVRFSRVIHKDTVDDFDFMTHNPWFFGPYGWVVRDIHALQQPIPCKGMQGLWTPDQDVQDSIVEQLPCLSLS